MTLNSFFFKKNLPLKNLFSLKYLLKTMLFQKIANTKVDGQEATFPRSQYQEATVRSYKKPVASWHWLFD
jgi:hypothetical protein